MGDIDNSATGAAGGATETKTWAASTAMFIVSVVALSLLSSVDTDMVSSLPDWLETPVYSLLGSAVVFFTAWNTRHKPGKLSLSALRAARQSGKI
jgi:hypothetical protein